MPLSEQSILFLHNPLSNEGRSQRAWQDAAAQFPLLPVKPVNILAIANLSEFIASTHPEVIAIAGGDGTINSVCQAVLSLEKKPLLAILPFGFGNALSYCLGVEQIGHALESLQHRTHRVTIDLMKLNSTDWPIGVFNISIGFDARIVHYRQDQKYIGFRSYVMSGIRSYIDHQPKELTITVDHHLILKATTSSLIIANCPIIGQNYVVADDARLNDGYLDCTLFSTKFAYLANLRLKGFRHPLYTGLGKVRFKAKHIKITQEPYVQVDGEPLFLNKSLTIDVLPKSVTFLRHEHIPKEYEAFL